MKKNITKTLALIATLCGLNAFADAPVPMSVWDKNFSEGLVSGNHKFEANSNTIADDGSYVQVSKSGVQSGGLHFVRTSLGSGTASSAATVIFKFDCATWPSTDAFLVSMHNNSTSSGANDPMGVYVDSSWVPRRVDGGAKQSGTAGTALTSGLTERKLAMTWNTSGWQLYEIIGDTATQKFTYSGSKSFTFGGCTIGVVKSGTNFEAANGMKLYSVALFDSVLTAEQLGAYKFDSEKGAVKGAKWGNIGDATNGGTADGSGGGNYYFAQSFTVNFATTDNICTKDIGGTGKVKITSLRIANRSGTTPDRTPTAITLTQGSLSATSTSVTTGAAGSGTVYKTDKTALYTVTASIATFDSDVEFDSSQDITVKTTVSGQTTFGCTVIKPANSKMKDGSNYAPALEFTGDYTPAAYDFTATVTADTNWDAIDWNEEGTPTSTSKCRITVDKEVRINFNADSIAVAMLALAGNHNIDLVYTKSGTTITTLKKEGTTTYRKVYPSGGDKSKTTAWTIPTDVTYVIEGPESGTADTWTSITVPSGATLLTRGQLKFSTGNLNGGGTLEVATGKLTNTCGGQKIAGHLVIDAGATYEQTSGSDTLAYGSNGVVVDVYGTLSLPAQRWTMRTANTINIYPGGEITGAGQGSYGALDADTAVTINVKKNGSTGGTATISARLRPRASTPAFTFNVASGMTLVLSGKNGDKYSGFAKTGSGTLQVTSASTYTLTGDVTVNAGTLKLEKNPTSGMIVVNSGATLETTSALSTLAKLTLNSGAILKPATALAVSGTFGGAGYVVNAANLTPSEGATVLTIPSGGSFGAFALSGANGWGLKTDGTALKLTQTNPSTFNVSELSAGQGFGFSGDVTLNFDQAPSWSGKVSIGTTGKLTLTGYVDVTPAMLAKFDFGYNTIEYAWRTRKVISINMGDDMTADAADGSLAGYVKANSWNNFNSGSGTDQAVQKVWNGSASATLSGVKATWGGAGNIYGGGGSYTAQFQRKYLDDKSGSDTTMTISGLPFTTYDVIIYYSADSNGDPLWKAPKVNDAFYNCGKDGITVSATAQTDKWGAGSSVEKKPRYGYNAIRVSGLSGTLSLNLGNRDNGRSAFAALQIIDKSDIVVAKIGNVEYHSLAAAEKDITSADQTISLQTDGWVEYLSTSKSFTFNYNSHTFNGGFAIGEGGVVTVAATFTKDLNRYLLANTTGDGTLRMTVGKSIEVHSASDSAALVANVNVDYLGTGELKYVGTLRDVDKFTVSAGKTVTFANGTIWPMRNELVVNGNVFSKYVSIGHSASGDYPGKVTINEGGVVKTEKVAFSNPGATQNSVLTVGGVLEFTQNDESAITASPTGVKYAVNLNGGTFKADASSWHVASDIAVTIAGGTFYAAEGKTLAIAGALSGSGNVSVTGAGSVVLNGANTDTGTYTVAEGASLTLGPGRTQTIDGASEGTITITLTPEEKAALDGGESVELLAVSGEAFAGTLKTVDSTGAVYEINDPTISGGKLVVTKKEGARMSPFVVTNPTNETWTIAGWMDSTPTTPLEVRPEDWDNKASANVTVGAGQEKALTTDRALPLGTLTLNNAGTLTVAANDANAITADALAINNAGTLTVSGNAITATDITINNTGTSVALTGTIATSSIDDSASTGATTIDIETAAPITAGANTILNTAATANNVFTIAADKKLTVKSGTLTASKITNSGTLNLDGGSEASPIILTGDNTFNNTTLTAGSWVWNKEGGSNKKYCVTGAGANSYYIITRGEDGAPGMASGTTLANLILVANSRSGQSLWVENVTLSDGTVGFYLKGELMLNNKKSDNVVRSLSGSGTLSRYHTAEGEAEGLTVRALEDAVFSGGCSFPITIDASTFTQTFSGANFTSALTVNEGAQVKLAGSAAPSSIANAGKVVFDVPANTTNFVAYAITGEGSIEIVGGGTVIFKDSSGVTPNTTITETSGKALFAKTVDINDLGKYTPVAPYTTANVVLLDQGGNVINATVVGDHLEYTWDVEGKNCWWAYEFNGTRANTGTDTVPLKNETTDPYYNAASNALRVGYSTSWRDVDDYPAEFTAVMRGKIVDQAYNFEMGFGSTTTAGTGADHPYSVAIASGNTTNNEVHLIVSEGFTIRKTVNMSVPNAYTADHLYAFVCKTINDGGTEKTKVLVYLDGVEWDSYTFSGVVTLGKGFQIGSVHGGKPGNYLKANDVGQPKNEHADLDFLRVYNTVLTQQAMTKYADKYPYQSPSGNASRTFTEATATWTATKAWDITEGGVESKGDKPGSTALVTIDADVASTVTMDLEEAATYEQLKIQGESAISLKAGGTVKPTISGLTTIGTDVTNDWNAIGIGKVMVPEGKTLTFDFTDFPFADCFAGTTNEFTGAVSGAGTITAIIPDLEGTGRTATFDVNEYGHYALTITVDATIPFVYTINEGEAGQWSWNGVNCDEPTDWTKVAATEIVKEGTGAPTDWTPVAGKTYTVNAGTLRFAHVPTQECVITVNDDGIFDSNGIASAQDTKFFTVTLNGGQMVNNNANGKTGLVKTLTLAKDATVETVQAIAIQSKSGGYADTTLALGDNHTLTKTGTNRLELVSTTVTGTGMIDVQGGTLWVQENDDFGQATVKVGANGTFATRNEGVSKKATVSSILGAGGLIDNAGEFSAFTLTGDITLTGNGTYGTITMAKDAVADIGTRRTGLTFAGQGTVDVKLTADEEQTTTEITAFNLAQDATTAVGKVYDSTGADVTSHVTKNGNKFTINHEAKVGTTLYITLANALDKAEADATVTLCTNVTGFAYTLEKNITLDGDVWEIAGTGFSGSGLTVASGFINVTSLGNGYTLTGGKYKNNTTFPVGEGYQYVQMAAELEGYNYMVIVKGTDPMPEDAKLYPVASDTDVGALAFSKDALVKAGIVSSEDTPAQITKKLDADGANGNKTWQNVALGLSNTDPTEIPVVSPAPVQGTSASEIKFALAGVKVDLTTGAKVTYKVMGRDTTSGDWDPVSDETAYDANATVNLPTSGVKYYKFEVTVTPAR